MQWSLGPWTTPRLISKSCVAGSAQPSSVVAYLRLDLRSCGRDEGEQ
jgi:hypothetical protein